MSLWRDKKTERRTRDYAQGRTPRERVMLAARKAVDAGRAYAEGGGDIKDDLRDMNAIAEALGYLEEMLGQYEASIAEDLENHYQDWLSRHGLDE